MCSNILTLKCNAVVGMKMRNLMKSVSSTCTENFWKKYIYISYIYFFLLRGTYILYNMYVPHNFITLEGDGWLGTRGPLPLHVYFSKWTRSTFEVQAVSTRSISCFPVQKGNTALHIASLAGQREVVKLLVKRGADINSQSQVRTLQI